MHSGGTAHDTILNSGGSEIISAGGTARNTTVVGGNTDVEADGVDISATIRGADDAVGIEDIFSGGTAVAPNVSSDGQLIVAAFGTAFGATITRMEMRTSRRSARTSTRMWITAASSPSPVEARRAERSC